MKAYAKIMIFFFCEHRYQQTLNVSAGLIILAHKVICTDNKYSLFVTNLTFDQ